MNNVNTDPRLRRLTSGIAELRTERRFLIRRVDVLTTLGRTLPLRRAQNVYNMVMANVNRAADTQAMLIRHEELGYRIARADRRVARFTTRLTLQESLIYYANRHLHGLRAHILAEHALNAFLYDDAGEDDEDSEEEE